MRKPHLLAALAAVVVVVASLLSLTPSGSDAAAQSPIRPPVASHATGPVIALLDVSYIFKNHVRLKARMDEMKKEVDAAETWVKTERDAVMKLTEQLKQFNPGSRDYKSLEQEITTRKSTLAVKIQQQKRDFLLAESNIYHGIYQEIQQEVNYYCNANGVGVVLRFSREPANLERPDTVLAYINKPVVTYNKNLDITDLILSNLNRRPVSPTGGNTTPIGTRPRAGVPFK